MTLLPAGSDVVVMVKGLLAEPLPRVMPLLVIVTVPVALVERLTAIGTEAP
jgi:hypothetical protein